MEPPMRGGVRAWVARPDALRVESSDGVLLVAKNDSPRPGSRALLTTGGGQVPPDPPPAAETIPVFDEDGLVAERPGKARYDDPMFQSYHWVAMLDPSSWPTEWTLSCPPERGWNRRCSSRR